MVAGVVWGGYGMFGDVGTRKNYSRAKHYCPRGRKPDIKSDPQFVALTHRSM